MYGNSNYPLQAAFAGMVKVIEADSIEELVKEAQMVTGRPTRKFFDHTETVSIGYDGRNLLLAGKVLDPVELRGVVKAGVLYTEDI